MCILLANSLGTTNNEMVSSQSTGLRVASILFAIFALAHIVRLAKQARVMFGATEIPMSVSVVALIIAGGLSIWMWRLSSSPG